MTPAEVEAIKETIKVASQNKTWCEAIVSVIKTTNLATIKQAASSVNMSVSSFIAQFGVALSEPSKILRPILQNTHLTEGQATQYLYDAQKLVNNGVPEALRAGAGGAGAAATGVAAGKGAIILKGLAIIGGLIAFAVVSYYVAGVLGEWSADKPIEPGWNRPVYSSDFIATIDGVDVTNTLWSEPGTIRVVPWIYSPFYNHDCGGGVVHTKTFGEMCDFLNDEFFRDIYGNQNFFTYMVATRDRSVRGGWRHDQVICDREILYMKKVDSCPSSLDPILIEERV